MKSFSLVVFLLASAFVSTTFASDAKIVGESSSYPITVREKHLTVEVMCRVAPAYVESYEGGRYHEAFCNCGFASIEINDVVKTRFPTALKVNFPGSLELDQPMKDCGVKPLVVDGVVTYVIPRPLN